MGPKELTAAAQKAFAAGHFTEAERLWTKLLQLARRTGNRALREQATVRLARSAAARGRPVVARALLQQSLKGAKARKDQRRMALLYAVLGDVYRQYGRLDRAVDHYLWAKMYAKAEKLQTLRTRVLSRLADIAALRGRFDFALQAMAEVTLLVGGLRGLRSAHAALEAGRVYARLADQKRARRYLGIAQMEFQARGLLGRSAEALVALASLAVDAGDKYAAKRDFRQAVKQLAEIGAHRRHAAAAWLFARALDRWGTATAAEKQRAAAHRSFRALGDDYNEALLELDTARSLQRRRRFKDSVAVLGRAVSKLERAGDRFSAGEARILLGRARVQLGQAAEALGELTRALDHTAKVGAPELSWQAYALLGFLTDTLLDREDKAARFHKGAVRALERVRAGMDLLGGADARAEDNAYYELCRVYVKQWRRGGEPAHFDAVLATLERNRSRRLLDLLTRAGASLADTRKERIRVRALSGEERAIAEQLAEPGPGLVVRKQLYRRLSVIRSLRSKVEGKAFRFAAAHPAAVSVGILKSAIAEKEAVLIYLVGQRSSLLIGINDAQSVVVNLPGRAELDRLVSPFVKGLFGRADTSIATLRRLGRPLYAKLVAPVAKVLSGRPRVHIVLGGALWRLPFAALPEGSKGWLGDRRTFVRIPSPAVWLKVKATPRGQDAKQELLTFAVPGSAAKGVTSPIRDALLFWGHRLKPLVGARERGQRLLKVLGRKRATLKVGREASEDQLRKLDLTQFRRLHFASRLVLPARTLGPVQPTLALSGAKGSDSDGLLLLRELLGLKLDHDLISVESLDLGRGRPDWHGQESVARALLLAGARTVLFPLAQPTAATADRFFTAFYGSLAKQPDKAVAMTAALRALRLGKRTRHPRHLATYVLYGAL